MYFQISLRSRLAVAEILTLANPLQLSNAAFFSGFALQALHVEIGNLARANIVQAPSNLLPQTVKLQSTTIIAIGQQAERLTYDFTGGLVSAFAELALDESFQLWSERDIHESMVERVSEISNICYLLLIAHKKGRHLCRPLYSQIA